MAVIGEVLLLEQDSTITITGVGAIASDEAFGATKARRVVGAAGLASSEAFGTTTLTLGSGIISGVGAILSPDEYGAGSYGDGGYGTQFGVATVLVSGIGQSVYGGVLLSDVAVYAAEIDEVLVNAAQITDGCVYAGSTDDALLYAEHTGDVLVFAGSTDDLPGH